MVGNEEYAEEAFSQFPNQIWKTGVWHYNHRNYQVGGKMSGVTLELYDIHGRYGAIAATGHEHSYCRTYTMSSFRNYIFDNATTNVTLDDTAGESFVFVGGLAGQSIRSYEADLQLNPWWASTAASNDGVGYGALLCTFNVDGNERLGYCFFQDINGVVWDEFHIFSNNALSSAKAKTPKPACSPKLLQHVAKNVCSLASSASEEEIASFSTEKFESVPVPLKAAAAATTFVDRNIRAIFQFPVNVIPGETVSEASLEVLGRNIQHDCDDCSLLIRSVSNNNLNCNVNNDNDNTEHYRIQWKLSDTDWEENIWQSSEITSLISEFVKRDSYRRGDVITLAIESNDENLSMAFENGEVDDCLLPTLAVHVEKRCDNNNNN